MVINTAIIQHRRGSLDDFNPEKLTPGELAVITDERSVYMGFPGGEAEKIVLEKDFTSESIKEKLGYEPADEERVDQLFRDKADYQYVDKKVSNVKVDLTGYAKEDYVDDEIEELNKKIVQETGKLSEEIEDVKGDLDDKYKNLITKSNFKKYNSYKDIKDVWNCRAGTVTISNGEMVLTSIAFKDTVDTKVNVIEGHKYYAKVLGHSTTDQVVRLIFLGVEVPIAKEVKTYSFITTASESKVENFKIIDYASVTRQIAYIKNALVVDLTELFGSGNEPTNEDFTKFIELFEDGYFSQNANISELLSYIENKISEPQDLSEYAKKDDFIFDYYTPLFPIPDYSDTSSKPLKNVSLNEMMTMWGDLVNYYPRLTKEVLGKDSSGQYDIWKITYKPDSPKMKMVMVANVHGYTSDSKSASLCLYYLMYDINRNYRKSKALWWLHENVEFVFIPIGNPYGWVTGSRFNANSVNINRNYDYNFEVTDESGSEPFSEVETRYIRDMILSNKDAIGFFDVHCYGDDSVTENVEYCGIYFDEHSVAYKVEKDLANYFSRYCYDDVLVNLLTGRNATATNYVEGKLGINATCLEFSTKPETLEQFSSEHIYRQLEWYGNVIYKWAHDYPMLNDYILGENGNKYRQSVNQNGELVLTKIN